MRQEKPRQSWKSVVLLVADAPSCKSVNVKVQEKPLLCHRHCIVTDRHGGAGYDLAGSLCR